MNTIDILCWFAKEMGGKVLVFTDGSCLRLMVDETEVGEYGIRLIFPGRMP